MTEAEIVEMTRQVVVLYEQGKFAEGIRLAEQVVELPQALGADHPDYAASLNNLAELYRAMGRYAEAEPLYREATGICRQALGADHPHYAASLNNLAAHRAATRRYDEALEHMSEGARIQDRLLARIAASFPEKHVLTYARMTEGTTDLLLTLAWRHMHRQREAVGAALDLVLRRKAFTLEATAAQHEAALSGRHPEAKAMFDRLREVRMELARRTLAGPPEHTQQAIQAHRQKLEALKEQCDTLERDLARRVPEVELQHRLRAADRQAVALHLPPGSVLVDFVRFEPCRFEATGAESPWEPSRYLAFILPSGKPDEVQMIDLGAAEGIDAMIAAFREHILGPARGGGADAAAGSSDPLLDRCRELHARLLSPLEEAVGHAPGQRLVLSPDGELTLLPFEALLGADGRFVGEAHQVSYVASGRDVLRWGAQAGEPGPALIVADPDFDLWAAGDDASPNPESLLSDAGARRSRDFDTDVGLFDRLPATRAEGESVTATLAATGVPVGAPWFDRDALEKPLKAARAPRILHLATHGFFEKDQDWKRDEAGGRSLALSPGQEGGFLPPGIENPLLRAGLALAGANAVHRNRPSAPEAEDGILSALDVTGLDLYGTELVTLSACDTGVGEVRRGEGVFGLRRAFHLAGAQTLVMSLWKVPDDETRWLMESFYRKLGAGLGKADALRQAQLDLIARLRQRDGKAHPLFWAAFICQGDPAPLRPVAKREV